MPKGHNEQLAWYHVRMMSRQIMKVVDPDRLWEFEASDYDLQTFRRILKVYGGSYNDRYWDKVDECPCAKNINEYIFKVRTNIDIAGVGDSGAKLHGKSKKGSIAYDLWEQMEFAHDKPNVKIPSLRGNVEWHMLSGASLKGLIEQCETMYAKRFGGDQSTYGHYDIVIVQAYGNEMFPNSDKGEKLFKLSAVPKDFDDDLKKLVEVLSKLSIRSFIMFGGSATLFQIEGPWKEFVDQKVELLRSLGACACDGRWYWLGIQMKSDWHAADTPSNHAQIKINIARICNALFAIHPPHRTQLVNYNPERHKKEVGLEFLDHPLIPVAPLVRPGRDWLDNMTRDHVENDPAAEFKKQQDKADLEAAMYTGSSGGSVCSDTMGEANAPCPGNGLGVNAELSLPSPSEPSEAAALQAVG